MFDFPSGPVPGQEYTLGGVSYVWNGYGWAVKVEEDTGGEVLDAYNKSESDARFVNVAGDTMTGTLQITNGGALRVYVDANHQFQAYSNAVLGAQQSGIGQGGRVEVSGAGVLSGIKTYPAFPSYNLLITNEGPVGFKLVRHDAGSTPTDGALTTLLQVDGVRGNASLGGVAPSIFTTYAAPARILNVRTDNVPSAIAVLDLTGNATVDYPIGHVSFSNQSNTAADKRIGAIGVSRFGNDASGKMDFLVWEAGTFKTALSIFPTGLIESKGDIKINKVQPALILDKTTDAGNVIYGRKNGVSRWYINVGAADPETGGNVGSGFYLTRCADDGSVISDVLGISRATGAMSYSGDIGISGNLTVWGSSTNLNGPSGQSTSLNLAKAIASDVCQSYFNSEGKAKWLVRWCDAGEGHMNFYRYNADASAIVGTPISLNWTNGDINLNAGVGTLMLQGGSLYVGPTATFASGALWVHNNTADGTIYLGNTATCYLQSSGGAMYLNGPPLTIYPQVTMSGMLLANGKISINSSTGLIANSSGSQALEVKSAGVGNSAFMAFHIPGSFAANFGVDTDTFWKVGGWSMGGVAHKVFHEGVCPNSGSYFKLTSGLMVVMGTCPVSMGNGWVTFPVAFPNGCVGVVITGVAALGDGSSITCNSQAFEPSRFYFQPRYVNSGGAVGVATQEYKYIAWGY